MKMKFWYCLFLMLTSSVVYAASDADNYDGTYLIRYQNSKCGDLGYAFKLLHQRDGYSSTSKMRKSDCRINSAGQLEGYIYPSTHRHLRIFWHQTTYNGVTYRD